MKDQLIRACKMHALGELERAKTNILVYMNKSVGIGEHSDIVEAIQKELDTMASAQDRIDMLEQHFVRGSAFSSTNEQLNVNLDSAPSYPNINYNFEG